MHPFQNLVQKALPARVSNYFFTPATIEAATAATNDGKQRTNKNASYYIFPAQLARLRVDVLGWRDAIREAEMAFYPQRVKMQRMYNDVIVNGHTLACWERRKDLTLLRDFKLCNSAGVENEELKKLFQKPWFQNFVSFALDAMGYGYSLIALGDIIADAFPKISVVRRWNVSPDRLNVTAFTYAISGLSFIDDEDVKQWHVWVPTVNNIGSATCGFGLFYEVALPAIYLRNNIGNNMDYAENFGQPIRKGKTTKTEEAERAEYAQALANMGSDAWILLDPTDELELIESKPTGQGFKVYESIESRCQKEISKIILGHSDALDSVPGKLGAGSGEDNPVTTALLDKQTKDGQFIEPLINEELLTRMRELGFNIPDDIRFEYKNDDEKEAFRRRQDESNKVTAEIAQTMKNAGLKMDAKYFEERTGIKTTDAPEPDPTNIPFRGKKPVPAILNKLRQLYNGN